MSEQKTTDMSQHFYRASAADFIQIPGSPVAYWVSQKIRECFAKNQSIEDFSDTRIGLITGKNDYYIRDWSEVKISSIGFMKTREDALASGKKWFPQSKGGDFRRWYGNNETILKWEKDGEELQTTMHDSGKRTLAHNFNLDKIFLPGITWTKISSSLFGVRLQPEGFLFNDASANAFPINTEHTLPLLAFLCSKLPVKMLKAVNPTLNFLPGNIKSLPIVSSVLNNKSILENTRKLIIISKNDWDSFETSWDFTSLPLLAPDIKQPALNASFTKLRAQWLAATQEMQRLEEENNRIFIDAYGLQDELTPEVPLKEITLTCNPHYRYGGDLTEQQREDRLQSDTIAELISYAIGCMMGRYSLNREGLVYAHAGNEGFADLVAEGAYQTFAADDDGILPLTEQEWFSDDVTNLLSKFIRTVWGEQHLEENLQFIADSLCLHAIRPRKDERALDTIRRYLSNQFYKDHLSTYKRRPIYWLFSSGKHKAFECLVYLHRYHEGTLARMRAEYVIPLSSRINARINRLSEEAEAASTTTERNQINRELKALQNQQAELATFDEQLRHHADMRISLDLDDGVKENYGKFGNLLDSVRAVTGKAPK